MTVKALDTHVLWLHQLTSAMTPIEQSAKFHKSISEQTKKSKKGGEAKAKRTKDLKDIVLTEAFTLHSDKTATKAAKAIFEKLSKTNIWLVDEREKDLLKDPILKFTEWIRTDRSESNK